MMCFQSKLVNPGRNLTLQRRCLVMTGDWIFKLLRVRILCRMGKRVQALELYRSYPRRVIFMGWTGVKLSRACDGCERAIGLKSKRTAEIPCNGLSTQVNSTL